MTRVARYTKEIIAQYEQAGYWIPQYPVDFWEENARRFPDGDALAFGTDRFTWRSAVQAIDRLALGLVRCGLVKGDILALQAPNSAVLMLLRLAMEKAGVISLLIPPSFSRAEIGAIVGQLQLAGVVLSNRSRARELADVYRAGAGPSIKLLSIGKPPLPHAIDIESWLVSPGTSLEITRALDGRRFEPYGYASIITTSGTTGVPRLIEHTACARMASGRIYIDRLRLTSNDVIAGIVSIFAGNCDLIVHHTAPQVGAKIVLIDYFEPESVCRLLQSERVTCAVFVPTLLHRLLAYDRLGQYDFSSLRIVTSFGAILAPETAAEVERALGVTVIQGYGASDYGALASTAIDDPQHVRLAGVGRPLTGTELRICNDQGAAVVPGVPGRIFARGPHSVGGFVGDEPATAQAWESGYYALGDFGHMDDDGYLWLAGRIRELIIRGGQNIVPAEVESVILRHPRIAEVAVIGLPDDEMGERVCAAVVTKAGTRLTLEAIQEHLTAAGLARFKHPERLILLDSMPMNPAATKIDKRALYRRAQVVESVSDQRGSTRLEHEVAPVLGRNKRKKSMDFIPTTDGPESSVEQQAIITNKGSEFNVDPIKTDI